MSWRARTWKDELAARRAQQAATAAPAASAAPSGPALENPRVRCGCGRWESADIMLDVRALPASLRPKGAAYICHACRERLIHTGQIAREDLYRLLGAPPEIVARMRAFALAYDTIRRARADIPLPSS